MTTDNTQCDVNSTGYCETHGREYHKCQSNTQELDEILAKHGAEPGEMTHSLKQAILRWVADEVIGENETGIITNPDSVDYGEHYSNVYVDRDEQRKILAQHGYKGANQ